MNAFGLALLAIFCTPMGWMGLIIFGLIMRGITCP